MQNLALDANFRDRRAFPVWEADAGVWLQDR